MTLTQRERAVALLLDLFRLHPQGVEKRKAISLAEMNGISERTMLRAAAQLGVRVKRNGPKPGFWVPS
jgi:DNA-binding MurR/RpiR family transcriptional regulator